MGGRRGSRGGFRATDKPGQAVLEAFEGGRVGDFLPFQGGDVERVHGHAFFGANAGMGGAQTVLVDGQEQIVKQTNAVEGLDLHSGANRVELVADVGLDGDGNIRGGAWREVVGAQAKVALRFHRILWPRLKQNSQAR